MKNAISITIINGGSSILNKKMNIMGFTYDFSLIGGVCVLSVITFGTSRLASIT